MPTAEKIEKIEELSGKLSAARALFLADFTGVDVASVTELRNSLRSVSVEYQVVKNRLARRALEAAGLRSMEEFFSGPTAVAFVRDDPVEPARILKKFIDGGAKLDIKSALVENRILSPEEFVHLASLPSREELIARVVGGAQRPLVALAAVLAGLLRNLVGVLAALEEKQRKGESAQPGEC